MEMSMATTDITRSHFPFTRRTGVKPTPFAPKWPGSLIFLRERRPRIGKEEGGHGAHLDPEIVLARHPELLPLVEES
jgi:hypothetical protein